MPSDTVHGLPGHLYAPLHRSGMGSSALDVGWRQPHRLGHSGGHTIYTNQTLSENVGVGESGGDN